MELKPATKKNFFTLSSPNFFPRQNEVVAVGYFNGISCCVKDRESMMMFFESGFYGKGNLSKSFPNFNTCHDDFPEFIQEQQWSNRKNQSLLNQERDKPGSQIRKRSLAEESILNFTENSKKPRVDCKTEKIDFTPYLSCHIPSWTAKDEMVENNCESNYFKDILEEKLKSHNKYADSSSSRQDEHVVVVEDVNKARLENQIGAPKEELHLNLQESFFLAGMVGVLHVFDQLGKKLTVDEMWSLFQNAEPEFLKKYVAYHWYRSRGWVVRCGLIYGGDYVLYEKGPNYCHSSYVVRVQDIQSKPTWNELASMSRLCETVQKDIIYCTVMPPADLNIEELNNPLVIRKFKILEVMHRRWIPTHHLNQKESGV